MQIANLFSGESKKELEANFQKSLKLYRETQDKQALVDIWLRVYNACYANGGKILKGIYTNTFEDRVLNAAVVVMGYILEGNKRHKEGQNPRSLINYCFFPTKYALQGAPAIREDSEVSYEEYEKYKEIEPAEPIRGICRKELMCTRD